MKRYREENEACFESISDEDDNIDSVPASKILSNAELPDGNGEVKRPEVSKYESGMVWA